MTHPLRDDIDRLVEDEIKRSIQGIVRSPFGANAGVVEGFAQNAGLIFNLATAADAIPRWSIYPASRDRALRNFYRTEPIVTGAVYSMSTRIKSLEWKLTGEEDLQDEYKAIFEAADLGNGLQILIQKTVEDLCTQDNGFFWELLGMGDPDSPLIGGVVQGINYLDPAQCYRTFDYEFPVLYIDPLRGRRTRLHRSRVVSGASMPQPHELARGVGYCPVSRALLSTQLMKSIQQYRYEKASGSFSRAIGYGTGITQIQLLQLLQETKEDDSNEGFVRFGKIPFYVSPRKDVSLNILDLASIPDGFDLMSETDIYVYTVALAFGVDAREFWPATTAGATKGDASVQHLKSQGKGIADFITLIERAINRYILPDGMRFVYDFTDDEQDRLIADRNKTVVDTLIAIKDAGAIDAVQLQALLIHADIIDPDILEDADDIAIPLTEETLGEDPLASGANPSLFSANPMAVGDEPMNGSNPQNSPDMPMGNGDMPMMNEPPESNGEEDEEDEDEAEEKIAAKSQEQYQKALYAAVRAYWSKAISEVGLVNEMDSAIRRHYTRAAYDAAKMAGLLIGDISVEENAALQASIAAEQSYVVGFAQWIGGYRDTKGAMISVAFDRIKMWAGRYERIKSKFLALFAKDKKLQWKVGNTEHCIDCLNMMDRVYRASVWASYNLEPRSPELNCGGFRCQCKFEIADATTPVNKGKPPKFRGRGGKKDYSLISNWKLVSDAVQPIPVIYQKNNNRLGNAPI